MMLLVYFLGAVGYGNRDAVFAKGKQRHIKKQSLLEARYPLGNEQTVLYNSGTCCLRIKFALDDL